MGILYQPLHWRCRSPNLSLSPSQQGSSSRSSFPRTYQRNGLCWMHPCYRRIRLGHHGNQLGRYNLCLEFGTYYCSLRCLGCYFHHPRIPTSVFDIYDSRTPSYTSRVLLLSHRTHSVQRDRCFWSGSFCSHLHDTHLLPVYT